MASGCPVANGAPRDPTAGVGPARKTLTDEQKALIKATVPALEAYGTDITKLFYQRMLSDNPPLKNIFNNANQIHQNQPRALAGAVLAYAKNIDNLGALGPAVELMAAKHASLYVRPEQYEIVGKYLMQAIGDVLGDAVTPEIGEAWGTAYWQLADVLIKREDALYQGAAKAWTDWADFKIVKKVKENDEITSFYLEPVNEALKPLPSFLPGQVRAPRFLQICPSKKQTGDLCV
jgi:nitric oxide dioxygenase